MTSLRLLPYRTVDQGSISWDSWWFERDGVRQPLPTHLPGWDYASAEIIGITVDLNGDEVLEATGLDDLRLLQLVLLADCPSLATRFLAIEGLGSELQQRLEVSVEIPAGQTAEKLELSANLVLRDPPANRAPRVAAEVGARLASSPRRALFLEGESSRFPTDAVSFPEVGLENAPWTLSTTFEDLDDSFMGSVRLLVNEVHPLGQSVLSAEPEPLAAERLKMDVFRMLVSVVSGYEPASDYAEDSVGAVTSYMCDLYMRRTLSETTALYREEPLRFERLCYQVMSE